MSSSSIQICGHPIYTISIDRGVDISCTNCVQGLKMLYDKHRSFYSRRIN